MKQWLKLTFILLFFISFAFMSYAAQNIPVSLKPAPLFSLSDLEGKAVSLSEYKGKKAVVLLFWTTWCPYCREELKTLNKEYPSLAKDSIELLTINVGEPKHKVDNFVKSHSLSFKVLLDKDSLVSEDYSLMGVPTYFVINKSGQIVSTGNHFPVSALRELAANSV